MNDNLFIGVIIFQAFVNLCAGAYIYKLFLAYKSEQRMITWYQQRLRISPWMVKD